MNRAEMRKKAKHGVINSVTVINTDHFSDLGPWCTSRVGYTRHLQVVIKTSATLASDTRRGFTEVDDVAVNESHAAHSRRLHLVRAARVYLRRPSDYALSPRWWRNNVPPMAVSVLSDD